ncbi:MAG: asparagine synthase (glutamine-hydrolyzing) [Gammaproteobacteria bacterium]
MCGIHGIVRLRDRYTPDAAALSAMGRITRHRGPDDEGAYADADIQLGMRRLSIIDVAGGHQPISNEDRTVWAVCNGEIYNFRELRSELQAKGHRFSTASDSEVIVHLYEEFGDAFVERLSGMFGFALWDTRSRRLLLGRDRLGIKPVYYLHDDDRLIFASEAKAILQVPGVSAELESEALAEYLLLGYVPAPYSMFRGIRKLPPACVLSVQDGRVDIRRYWSLPNEVDESKSAGEWAEELLALMDSAVKAQMVSDVPLGAFLSGGIDSSSVVALMSRHSDRPVKTYSIGFGGSSGGGYYNELPYARQVAELFGADHQEIIVEPDAASLLPQLIWHLDEPMADAAFITTYLVSEFARRSVTVILSGVGGDELFGGYRRYLGEYYQKRYHLIPGMLRRSLLQPMARLLPSDRHSPLMNLSRYARSFILSSELPFEDRYTSYIGVYDDEQIEGLLGRKDLRPGRAIEDAFDRYGGDPLQRMFAVDLATQLPDDLLMLTDKMSMATSLECRVPLLDQDLVDFAARMPSEHKIRGRELKDVMKRALSGLLPDEILYRKKRGFGAPMGAWLKRELSPVLKSVLSESSVKSRGLFDWEGVDATIRAHESSRADNTDHLLSLLNLELWCRMYLDGQSAEDLAAEIGGGCAS